MAQNPFYIQPGGDYSKGLAGLTDIVGEIGERKREEADKQAEIDRINTMKQGALTAYQSGDPDKIRAFMISNPEMGQTMKQAFDLKFPGDSGKAYKDSLFRAAIDFDQAPELLEEMRTQFSKDGLDPQEIQKLDSFQEMLESDPEAAKKAIQNDFAAMADDDMWKRYQDITKETDTEETTDIQNFNHYQTLLRDSPEQAEEFAKFTGIKKDVDVKDDRTAAIKEFEYGLEHPEFNLAQQKKADNAKTDNVKDKIFESSTKLRKEFLDQSKEYKKVRDSYTRVVGSTEEPSPAGDLSLIFNYMKMLDPGSVVRESEFATAAATGSYGDRIQAAAQKVMTGERLAPEMREDFVSKAKVLMDGMQKQHIKRAENYTNIAIKNGLPVDEVVVDITAPEETGPQEITTQEEFNNLPQGAIYLEDGVQYRKP